MKKLTDRISKKFKEFSPTSWSVDNRISIYVIAIIITAYGLIKFNSIYPVPI